MTEINGQSAARTANQAATSQGQKLLKELSSTLGAEHAPVRPVQQPVQASIQAAAKRGVLI